MKSRPAATLGPSLMGLLAVAMGCLDPSVNTSAGCSFDEDCAAGERCVDDSCRPAVTSKDGGDPEPEAQPEPQPEPEVQPEPEMQPEPEPEPEPEQDAGPPACPPDGLENESASTAYLLDPSDLATASASAQLCPSSPEYFSAEVPDGQALQALALWETPLNLDIRYFAPEGPGLGQAFGNSPGTRIEAATRLAEVPGQAPTDQQVLQIHPVGPFPDEGASLQLHLRTGERCQLDASCVAPQMCLMPIWTPADGEVKGEHIFLGGVCGPRLVPCSDDNADNAAGEGRSDRQSNALPGPPLVPAWSCQLDEDWWVLNQSTHGDMLVTFTNESSEPASTLMAAYDEHGQMTAGLGIDGLGAGESKILRVPQLGLGDEVFLRMVQLSADDLGLYALDVISTVNPCSASCSDAAARFGRTVCEDGACRCPDPAACAAP